MSAFLYALQFLTTIPVPLTQFNPQRVGSSMVCFPLVGLLIAGILVGVDVLCSWLQLGGLANNVLIVVSLIIISGGLHLDGFSDTVDGWAGSRERNRILEIMRDAHAGVMGVLAVVSVILLKIGFLFSLGSAFRVPALVLSCVLGRWSMVAQIYLFPYARSEGKAALFMEGITGRIAFLATLFTLVCVLAAARLPGLLIFAVVAVGAAALGSVITRKLGGITGDTLGATNELMEVITLLAVCIWERIHYA